MVAWLEPAAIGKLAACATVPDAARQNHTLKSLDILVSKGAPSSKVDQQTRLTRPDLAVSSVVICRNAARYASHKLRERGLRVSLQRTRVLISPGVVLRGDRKTVLTS